MLAGASWAFAVAPYSEMTMVDLVGCCEVSEGLIFHHFGSKAGLYAIIVSEAIDRFGRTQTEAVKLLGLSVSAKDKACAGLEVYLEHVHTHPEVWAAPLLGGHEPSETIKVRARAYEPYVEALLRILGISGQKRHVYAAFEYFGLLDGACLVWVHGGCPETDRYALINAAFGALEGALSDWRVRPARQGSGV